MAYKKNIKKMEEAILKLQKIKQIKQDETNKRNVTSTGNKH